MVLMRIRLADPALRVHVFKAMFAPIEARTDQIKNKVNWTDCIIVLPVTMCKAIIVFFHRISSQSSAIPSSVIPSILKAQLNNKMRTEQQATASAYDSTRTLVAQSLLPIAHDFQKVV